MLSGWEREKELKNFYLIKEKKLLEFQILSLGLQRTVFYLGAFTQSSSGSLFIVPGLKEARPMARVSRECPTLVEELSDR